MQSYEKNYKAIQTIIQPETITKVLQLSRPQQVSKVLGRENQDITKEITFNEWFERMVK